MMQGWKINDTMIYRGSASVYILSLRDILGIHFTILFFYNRQLKAFTPWYLNPTTRQGSQSSPMAYVKKAFYNQGSQSPLSYRFLTPSLSCFHKLQTKATNDLEQYTPLE